MTRCSMSDGSSFNRLAPQTENVRQSIEALHDTIVRRFISNDKLHKLTV